MIKKKNLIPVVLILLSALITTRMIFNLWDSYLPDFETIIDSASMLSMGNNPYISKNLFTVVNYAPSGLLILYPLIVFSLGISSKIWLVLSILFFVATIFLLYKIKPISTLNLSVIIFLTTISFPYKFDFGMGQVNLFLLFLLVATLFLLNNKSSLGSGFLWSLSVALKIFSIIFIIPIFFRYKLKKTLLFTGVLLLILFIPFLIFDRNIIIYFLQNRLLSFPFQTGGDYYYNQSVAGFFLRMRFPNYLILATRLALLSFSVYLIFRHRDDLFFTFSMLTVSVLLVNSFTWQHHLVLLILPYYYLISFKNDKWFLSLMFISYILIAFNIKNPGVFMHLWYGGALLSHPFFGVFLLWILFTFKCRSR
ncbi:MAG: glycosyltransferase 87 family protein [Cyanobacteria bacterium]|nr:glycosyltransferase 87 family protein [Cyanobacteriota bacterium]